MVREMGEGLLAGLDPGLESMLASPGDPDVIRDHAWLAGVLPPPPARLLDAGCGDGAVAGWLTKLGSAGAPGGLRRAEPHRARPHHRRHPNGN
jgi:hypothetical protein